MYTVYSWVLLIWKGDKKPVAVFEVEEECPQMLDASRVYPTLFGCPSASRKKEVVFTAGSAERKPQWITDTPESHVKSATSSPFSPSLP